MTVQYLYHYVHDMRDPCPIGKKKITIKFYHNSVASRWGKFP